MSDYERMKQFIENSGYETRTDLDNLIVHCFLHYDGYIEEEGKYCKDLNLEYVEDCIEFVKEIGLQEFDYYN